MENSRVQLLRFSLIGAVGFIVDATVFWTLLQLVDVSPYVSRLTSYLAAATTTWWLNRTFTFRSRSPPARELLSFLFGNSLGAAINLSVFAFVVALFGTKRWLPIVAVAAGSLSGLSVNFAISRTYVFSRRRVSPAATAESHHD